MAGKRNRALLILSAISLIVSVFLFWFSTRETPPSGNGKIESAFTLLAADAPKAALARDRDAERYLSLFNLKSLLDEDLSREEFETLRGRAVEAIESFRDTTPTEEGRMWFDSTTSQLTIIDTPENVRRIATFLESLGFPAHMPPTPTPTPTPGLRPIS